MAEQPGSAEPGKKQLGSELLLPVAALLFTLYYFWTIRASPWTAQVSAFFVGSILIVLIAVLLIRSARQLRRGDANWRFDALLSPVAFMPTRLKLLAMTIAYILLVRFLGFTITTFLFLASAMLLLGEGRRRRLVLALSAVLSLGGYLLFIVAFQVRFPRGPFETFMKGLF